MEKRGEDGNKKIEVLSIIDKFPIIRLSYCEKMENNRHRLFFRTSRSRSSRMDPSKKTRQPLKNLK